MKFYVVLALKLDDKKLMTLYKITNHMLFDIVATIMLQEWLV